MNPINFSNPSAPAFKGTFLIPVTPNLTSQNMRDIGYETSKFTDMKNMIQVKEGMIVKIDDSKDKEYKAVMAKYGVTLKEVDPKIEMKGDMGLNSYKFMVSKLHPNDVDKKAEAFQKMDETSQNKEFIKIYNEFKNSPYSNENAARQSLN